MAAAQDPAPIVSSPSPAGARAILRRVLSLVGPGMITAAVVLGPGSITVSSKCGALMGYSVLWVVATATIMMVLFTRMGARIGLLCEESFLTTAAKRYGRWVAVLIGVCGLLIATGFQTGNNIGAGLAASEMFGGSMGTWAVVFTAVALVMLWTSSRVYDLLEKIMVCLVAVMIVSFFGNLCMVRPDAAELVRGFIPSRPKIFGLVVAISATTFSVAAAAFQPYLVRSKGWAAADLRKAMRDSAVGITTLGVISCVIMITSAAVLRPKGITVKSAVDMARQLEPLLGSLARWLFLFGLWAGAFSSFIVNALIGGTLMADGLGIGDRLERRWAKTLGSVVMLAGTEAALLYGDEPVQLLVMAQKATILGVPLIAVVMLVMANDRRVVGEHRNGWVANGVGAAALVWLGVLSVRQLLALVT